MARKGRRRNGGGAGNGAPRVVYVQAPNVRSAARPGVAARRRRRRARLRAARAGGMSMVSSAVGGISGGARAPMENVPVAIKYPQSNFAPVITPTFDGIEVSHRQKIATITGSAAGAPFAVSMNPLAHGWIGGIGEHFQHYQVLEAKYSFVSRVSTGSGGTVVMAPYYEANHPRTTLGNDVNGTLDFLRDLPGVKEFAVWASDSVGVVTSKFTRQIFRTLGLLSSSPANVGDLPTPYQESENPGWLMGICTDLSGSGGRDSGELWCDYRVRFTAPKTRSTRWVSYRSTSTDGADLQLNSNSVTKLLGDPKVMFPIATNTFRVGVSGLFTLLVHRTGSTPVEAASSWLIRNFNGDTVTTSRITDSIVSGAFAANSGMADHGLGAGSASIYIYTTHLRLYEMDEIVVPDLTSGTLTATVIHLYAGAPSMLYES